MYCKYCGRQIADDSKFCEYCGNLVGRDREMQPADLPAFIGTPIVKETVAEPVREPVQQPPEAPVEQPPEEQLPEEPEEQLQKSKKGLLWAIIGGAAALVIGLVILLVSLLGGKPTEVDLTQYVDFKVSGYDGHGKAVCEMDYDGLEVAVLGEYPKGSDSKTREKQQVYKEKAVLLRGAVTLVFEPTNNVKVGDVLSAEIKVDATIEKELDVQFGLTRKVTYTVKEKDLSGSSEIDLLGEFVMVRFEGLSGKASAAVIAKQRDKEYSIVSADGTEYTVTVEAGEGALSVKFNNTLDKSTETVTVACSLDKKTEIATGDKVTLAIDEGDKEALMEYGLVISKLSAEFVAEGLESLVTKFSEIDKKTLSGWKTTYGDTLKQIAEKNWDYYFHGGNAMTSVVKEMEEITCCQGLLAGDGEKNELFLIYSAKVADDAILAENYGLSKTLYFAVRVSNLRLDAEGKLLEDKVLLPQNNTDDFIGSFYDLDSLIDSIADGAEYVLEK